MEQHRRMADRLLSRTPGTPSRARTSGDSSEHVRSRRPRTTRARLASVAGWVLVVLLAALAWPVALGGGASWVVVSGASMEPTFYTGDLVLAWRSNDWAEGDIVVYSLANQDLPRVNIVHRLTAGDEMTGWQATGDNKPRPDPWRVPDADIEGRVLLHIPHGGHALQILRTPLVLAVLAGALVTAAILARPDTPGQSVEHVDPVEATAVEQAEGGGQP